MEKIHSIQYLRAVAALAVVINHVTTQMGPHGGRALEAIGKIGAAGVDIFFVISGLVMWLVTVGKAQGPSEFFINRLIRIVPLYWAITLGKTSIGLVHPGFGEHSVIGMDHLILSLLFIPHRSWADGSIFPVLTAGWTLTYEMFFYCIFAIGLVLPFGTRLKYLIVAMVSLVTLGLLFRPTNAVIATYTNTLLLEFLAGALLGAWYTNGKPPSPSFSMIAMAVGVMLFGTAAMFEPSLSFRVIIWGIPAFLIVSGAVFLEKTKGIFRSRALTAMGDASYSTYLLHGLFAVGMAELLQHLPNQLTTVELLIILFALTVVIHISALLCYKIFEVPVGAYLRALRRRFSKPASSMPG